MTIRPRWGRTKKLNKNDIVKGGCGDSHQFKKIKAAPKTWANLTALFLAKNQNTKLKNLISLFYQLVNTDDTVYPCTG